MNQADLWIGHGNVIIVDIFADGKKKSIQERDLNITQSIKYFWLLPCKNVHWIVENNSIAVGSHSKVTPALWDLAPGIVLAVLMRSRSWISPWPCRISCGRAGGLWDLQVLVHVGQDSQFPQQFPDLTCSMGALFRKTLCTVICKKGNYSWVGFCLFIQIFLRHSRIWFCFTAALPCSQ